MVEVLKHALTITWFVAVMMLVVEYVNVLVGGSLEERLAGRRYGQYILAAALGAVPGCLGAFAVVAMYSHRAVSFGAVVTAMIATSGDEAFVMLALIPKEALILTAVLFIISIVVGILIDLAAGSSAVMRPLSHLELETHPVEQCECFPKGRILQQWKECSVARGILSLVMAVFIFALVSGEIGPPAWNWIRITLLVVSGVALFVISTVPDHFLEEHLWRHVALHHVPRLFAWTLVALALMHYLTEGLSFDLSESGTVGKWVGLLTAGLFGLIPNSGPHLIFVTLYAEGGVPFSILLASSIVQDGHGMLPLLAESRRVFVAIKAINFIVGLLLGSIAMALGI